MRGGRVVLSGRLQMLAGMVTPGSVVADVGCDHAFLSIYLVQQAISPRALAMDVRQGPLAAAREHITDCGLSTYIETRLSDGLEALRMGEADSLVCAGMGGRLMRRILRDGIHKARAMRELILQPQSEVGEFRAFLRWEGFRITAEDAVCEEGKYYFAMRAVYAGGGEQGGCAREACEEEDPAKAACEQRGCARKACEEEGSAKAACEPEGSGRGNCERTAQRRLYDEYGERLLTDRHPVLRQYLEHQREAAGELCRKLEAARGSKAGERLAQIRGELDQIEMALRFFEI